MASANPSEEQEFKQLQRHPEYYLSGGDVHFLVENQLFRVHRYFFERESPIFRDQIRLPPTPGLCDGHESQPVAIVLDVTAAEFEKLLGVFYNPRYSLFDWTVADWTTILELSQKWEFGEVRKLAIRELGKLKDIPLIERIALYQRFKVETDLLIPLYGILCSRPEPLNDEDSEAIGIKTTVLIFTARERLRAQPSYGGLSPLPSGLDVDDVHRTLQSLFDATPVSPTNQPGLSKKGKQADRTGQSVPLVNSNGRTSRPVGPAPPRK